MKTKRVILMLTVVSLLVAIPTLAKKPTGALGPPLWDDPAVTVTTATIDEVPDVAVILLNWLPVTGAEKYSVDVTGIAVYDTGDDDPDSGEDILAEVEVEASFGTSDRLDGGDMADDELNIPISDIADIEDALMDALADALEAAGLDESAIVSVELTAKVKALDPSVKPTKRQNNPFSTSETLPLPSTLI